MEPSELLSKPFVAVDSKAFPTETVKDTIISNPKSSNNVAASARDGSNTTSTISAFSTNSSQNQKPTTQKQQQDSSTDTGSLPTADRETKTTRGGFGNRRRMEIDEDCFADPSAPELESALQQQTTAFSKQIAQQPIQQPKIDAIGGGIGGNNGKSNGNKVIGFVGTTSSFPPPKPSNKILEKEKSTSVPISDGMAAASTAMNSFDETASNSSSGKFKTNESAYGELFMTEAICRKVDASQNMFWLILFDLKEDVINEFRSASMWRFEFF